jgi:isocitrate dehydrogenase (NAD+)
MQMVSRPQQFDVLAMGNLYGDIVSDLGAGIVGGISAAHGINVGDGVRVYECFHGRGAVPEGKANPVPLLLPAIDLLESLGQGEAGRRILAALEVVFSAGRDLTPDLGGQATTAQMTDAVVAALGG